MRLMLGMAGVWFHATIYVAQLALRILGIADERSAFRRHLYIIAPKAYRWCITVDCFISVS